jgi:UDP:flavonoid glycosyltransferase YjiC (YdhE family)
MPSRRPIELTVWRTSLNLVHRRRVVHAMKILFSTRPAFGHIYPMMPTALAARAAGHEVHFATAGPFVPRLAALGFPTHHVGLTIDEARAAALASFSSSGGAPKGADGRPDLEFGARFFLDVIAPSTASDLQPIVESFAPDVVVYEQMEVGAAMTAHVAGIPAICHSLSPRMPDAVIEMMAAGRVEGLWARFGKPDASFDVFTGDRYLDIFPPVLQQPSILTNPARVSMRPVAFAEPDAVLPAWVATRRRPLVYLTLGTIVATDAALRPAIEGLATLDVDVLLALGSADGAALGPMPANVHPEAFVDQAALMAHVDLAVHHGGSGTLLTALANGTPQLILPKGADQFWNADAAAAAELASVLEPTQETPDAVATLAKVELLERRPALDAMRDEIAAMPHPGDVFAHVLASL